MLTGEKAGVIIFSHTPQRGGVKNEQVKEIPT
jgi:hypothetical protein